MEWGGYYSEIDMLTRGRGIDWLEDWEVQYEWVMPSIDNFKKALQFAPLQTIVHAWENPVTFFIGHPGYFL